MFREYSYHYYTWVPYIKIINIVPMSTYYNQKKTAHTYNSDTKAIRNNTFIKYIIPV